MEMYSEMGTMFWNAMMHELRCVSLNIVSRKEKGIIFERKEKGIIS
jgi:hypothetical protein